VAEGVVSVGLGGVVVVVVLTSKCASRHSGGEFFRHLNFQKWSGHVVIVIFISGPQRRDSFPLSYDQMVPHPPL
jgi:hypothetical protein